MAWVLPDTGGFMTSSFDEGFTESSRLLHCANARQSKPLIIPHDVYGISIRNARDAAFSSRIVEVIFGEFDRFSAIKSITNCESLIQIFMVA